MAKHASPSWYSSRRTPYPAPTPFQMRLQEQSVMEEAEAHRDLVGVHVSTVNHCSSIDTIGNESVSILYDCWLNSDVASLAQTPPSSSPYLGLRLNQLRVMAAGLSLAITHVISLAQPSFPILAPAQSLARRPCCPPQPSDQTTSTHLSPTSSSPELTLAQPHPSTHTPFFPSNHHYHRPLCRPERGRTRRRSSKLSRLTRRTAKRSK